MNELSHYKNIVNTSTDAIFSIDSNHIILSCNSSAEKIFKYRKEELIGKEIYEIIPSRYHEQHKKGVDRFLKTKTPKVMGRPIEVFGKKGDGTEFPIELTLSYWEDNNKIYFSGIIRDVSKRVAMMSRLQSILDTTEDAIIGIDSDNNIFAWNPAAEKMFGYTKQELVGKKIMTIIPERFKKSHESGVDRFLNTKIPNAMGKPIEVAALRKDGSEFPIELTISHWQEAEESYFSGIIRNITERKVHEMMIKKNHELLIHEKKIVEEKQKEISDSIDYARKIQDAMLPSKIEIQSVFPESFILYKPKDIVSGDFYWYEYISQINFVYIAVADCTGHGVPGAMVSVVCSNVLSKVIQEDKIYETGPLLDKVRTYIINWLGKGKNMRDGMDISLCRFDITDIIKGKEINLQWSGAFNPLIIVSDNKLIKLNPDSQPVGHFITDNPYTTHNLKVKQSDCIYLFSDGYNDQFGGEKGKKFKKTQMYNLLLDINMKSMNEQKEILEEKFENWKGNHEQVDDVCIIGLKIV